MTQTRSTVLKDVKNSFVSLLTQTMIVSLLFLIILMLNQGRFGRWPFSIWVVSSAGVVGLMEWRRLTAVEQRTQQRRRARLESEPEAYQNGIEPGLGRRLQWRSRDQDDAP